MGPASLADCYGQFWCTETFDFGAKGKYFGSFYGHCG